MSVYAIKRKKGTVYRYRFMIDGQMIQSEIYDDKQQCKNDEIKAKARILSGTYTEPSNKTVQELYKEYCTLNPVRYHSQVGRNTVLKNMAASSLAEMKISKVKSIHIEKFIHFLRSNNLKESTMRTYLNILFGFFNWLTKHEIIGHNPTTPIDLPPEKIPPKTVLTLEEYLYRLKIIKEDYYPLYSVVLLMGMFGLRCGEACGINVDGDFDFDNNTLTVSRQYNNVEHGARICALKTSTSERTIPIIDFALPLVKEHIHYVKKQFMCGNLPMPDDRTIPFCVSEKGGRMRPIRAAFYWKKIEKAHNWKHVRLYNLRHTFATICRDAGINIDIIADFLGHADSNTTKKIYAQKTVLQFKSASEKLDNLFKNA